MMYFQPLLIIMPLLVAFLKRCCLSEPKNKQKKNYISMKINIDLVGAGCGKELYCCQKVSYTLIISVLGGKRNFSVDFFSDFIFQNRHSHVYVKSVTSFYFIHFKCWQQNLLLQQFEHIFGNLNYRSATVPSCRVVCPLYKLLTRDVTAKYSEEMNVLGFDDSQNCQIFVCVD